jgi:hypothetical protein
MNRLGADEIPVVSNLERDRTVTVDEPLAEAELDQPDENVDADERIGNDGNATSVGVVIPKRHDHGSLPVREMGLNRATTRPDVRESRHLCRSQRTIAGTSSGTTGSFGFIYRGCCTAGSSDSTCLNT